MNRLFFGILLSLIVLALPLAIGGLQLRAATEILYIALFAVSFNLLFHFGGLLSFGHNVGFGLGGYALAVILRDSGATDLVILTTSVVVIGFLAGGIIGAVCVRLKGGYFALLTLAMAQFCLVLAIKWRSVTMGDDGLLLPRGSYSLLGIGGINLATPTAMYWFTAVVVVTFVWLAYFLTRTPLGVAVVAVRENEERAAAIGFNPYVTKLILFTLASMMAALAGMLAVLAQGVVTPEVFSVATGGNVLIVVMLGGTASFFGPLVGAVIYYGLKDGLSQATEYWQFFMGAALVAVVLFAPGGAMGIMGNLLRTRKGATSK